MGGVYIYIYMHLYALGQSNIDAQSPWFPVGKLSPQWQLVNFVRDALLRVAAEGTTIGLHRFCAAERRWKLCQTDEDFCKRERYVEDIFIEDYVPYYL